jgi:hypothetical protein
VALYFLPPFLPAARPAVTSLVVLTALPAIESTFQPTLMPLEAAWEPAVTDVTSCPLHLMPNCLGSISISTSAIAEHTQSNERQETDASKIFVLQIARCDG